MQSPARWGMRRRSGRDDTAQRLRHALAPWRPVRQGRPGSVDFRASAAAMRHVRPLIAVLLAALLLALAGCAFDPLHARRAAATAAAAQDHALTCAEAGACAIASPYTE